MALKKPKRVDSIGPLKELWEELHDKKLAVAITLTINLIISILLSGFMFMSLANAGHTLVPGMVNSYKITFSSLFWVGIVKSWYLTIILFIIFAYASFKAYRSLRKTYKKNYDENYFQSKTSSYGNNHFQTEEELEKNFVLADNIEDETFDILGMQGDKVVFVDYDKPALRNKGINTIVVGAPGTGKTSSMVLNKIFQLIRRGDSAITLDSKGDLYRFTSGVAKMAGYKVRVLNIKSTELKNSDGFDMFKSLKPDDPNLDEKADVLANTILENTIGDEKVELYWKDNEFNLIKAVIMAIAVSPSFAQTNTRNLPEVYNFLAEDPEVIQMRMEGFKHTRPEIYKAYRAFAKCETRNQGQIVNGAMIRLRTLCNPVLSKVLAADEIDTTAPMREPCLYYVIVPDQDNTYKFVSALFFTQLFMDQCNYYDKLPFAEQKKCKRVEYILDEFYSCGGISGLPQKLSTVRSRNIGITIILQSLSQLNALYKEADVVTIKNNCPITCSLGINEPSTAEELSKLFGNQTIITESHRYLESTGDVLHAHGTIQKTMSEQQRLLVYPDDFLNGNIERDEILYNFSDMMPVRLKKCYAELDKKANHFLYAEALRLMEEEGERIASKHKPVWRYNLEQAEKKKKQQLEKDLEMNNSKAKAPEPAQAPSKQTAPAPKKRPDTFDDWNQKNQNSSPLDEIFKGYDRT